MLTEVNDSMSKVERAVGSFVNSPSEKPVAHLGSRYSNCEYSRLMGKRIPMTCVILEARCYFPC